MKTKNLTGNPFLERPLDATAPIFMARNGLPEQIGSGVFLQINDLVYLLTATHVIDETGLDLFIPTDRGEFAPKGEHFSFSTPNTLAGSLHDSIDISLIEIDNAAALRGQYAFLSIKELVNQKEFDQVQSISFIGFPGEKAKSNHTAKTFESEAIIIHGPPEVPLDPTQPDFRILYDRYSSIGNNTSFVGPAPFGMSGGGCWVQYAGINLQRHYHLLGLGIAYEEQTDKIYGTHIGPILGHLAKEKGWQNLS